MIAAYRPLLRLLRGAGPRGLASMHPRNGSIVRPLLGCRRDALREWLADRHIAFADDNTVNKLRVANQTSGCLPKAGSKKT